MQLPRIIGHRGAAARAPENTLAGLRKAAEIGVRCVEFDVRLAGDGALVLFHDENLERTSNGRGRVRDHSSTALSRLDAGSWYGPAYAGEPVPTLRQAIAALSDLGLAANIEIKTDQRSADASAAALAETLEQSWPSTMAAPLVSSFATGFMATIRDIAPHWPRGFLTKRIDRGWRDAVEAMGCLTVNCGNRDLRQSHVEEVKQAGYPLAVFTVNDPKRARTLFAWGVDAVFTDAPDALLAALPPDQG